MRSCLLFLQRSPPSFVIRNGPAADAPLVSMRFPPRSSRDLTHALQLRFAAVDIPHCGCFSGSVLVRIRS